MKLYDIPKLKLETFHKVLHYITSNTKAQEPRYTQSNADMAFMNSGDFEAMKQAAMNQEVEPEINDQQEYADRDDLDG